MSLAPQLKNTLSFNLASGASVVLPHGLSNGQRALSPDTVFVPSPDLAVTDSNETSITLINQGGDTLSGSVLVESWHTVERAFGDKANTDLTPKPYIVVSVEGGNQPNYPAFPNPSTQRIIYARATGSDVTGDGRSIATAYKTFQRAVRDLPRQVLPNEFWRVDITDIDPEILPPNYALPALEAPFGGDFTATFPNPNIPFNTQLAVEILATPKLAAVAGAAFTCTAVNVDADTGLVEIVTDQNYAVAGSLKGLLVQCMAPNGLPAICGVVWNNTTGPNSTIYLSHTFLPDAPSSMVCSVFCLPVAGQPGSLRTQSAELRMQTGPADFIKSGFTIAGSGSFAIRGVKFSQVVPGLAFGVTVWRSATVWIEACDLPGFGMFQNGGCNFMINNYIHGGALVLQGPIGIYNSYFQNIPSMLTPMSNGACCLQMIGTVSEGCAPIGPRYDPFLPSNRGSCSCLDMRNSVVFNAIPDQLLGYIADKTNVLFGAIGAGNQIPGHGIIVRGGCVGIDHVKIWGCASSPNCDGINAEFCGGCTLIRSVTGGGGGIIFGNITDTPNGRHGIHLDDGAHVIVQDDLPTVANLPKSNVEGATGDLNVGLLGTKPWAGLTYILDVTGFGGPGGGAIGTGSYIKQKT